MTDLEYWQLKWAHLLTNPACLASPSSWPACCFSCQYALFVLTNCSLAWLKWVFGKLKCLKQSLLDICDKECF